MRGDRNNTTAVNTGKYRKKQQDFSGEQLRYVKQQKPLRGNNRQ